MRETVLLLTVILFSGIINARIIKEEKLEPAILEVVYNRHKVLDTLDMNNDYREDILTLKIGKRVSAFYNAERKTIDSLEFHDRNYAMERLSNYDMWKSKSKLSYDVLYKNYPENKIRVLDRYDLCGWLIDEEWELPMWDVTDSVTNIMGYKCFLAVTDFRGRRWEAWFTPQIPISDGPWKLCGLPGLILKAQDSKKHYVYEPLSIRTKGIGYVEYFDYDAGNRFITTREKGLPRKWKALHEDLYFKIVSSGMYGINNPNVKERKEMPHTNYDFEETDYQH